MPVQAVEPAGALAVAFGACNANSGGRTIRGRHRYVNGGQLSTNVFAMPGRLLDTRGPGTPTLFVSPGAPRMFLLGVSYAFGGAAAADD